MVHMDLQLPRLIYWAQVDIQGYWLIYRDVRLTFYNFLSQMEVTVGVVNIYSSSENKETALQREYVALCDIQNSNTECQRSYSFVLKRAGREPIWLGVDSESGKFT